MKFGQSNHYAYIKLPLFRFFPKMSLRGAKDIFKVFFSNISCEDDIWKCLIEHFPDHDLSFKLPEGVKPQDNTE